MKNIMHVALLLFALAHLLTVPLHAQEQYQDIVIAGEVISSGSRECENRYNAIKPIFDKFNRPFTVLDIGASQGYFSFRLGYEYPNSVAVMIEGNYDPSWTIADQLFDLCRLNSSLENIIYLKKHITIEELQQLGTCEHFDVVLALNIIHHFGDRWKEAADAIFNLGEHIVIETPPSNDRVFANNNNIKEFEAYLAAKNGTVLCKTPRHTDPTALASTTYFQVEKPTIIRKHWLFGTPTTDTDIEYIIKSDFNSKQFIKQKGDQSIVRDWHAGINLMTFKALNGVWPTPEAVVESMLEMRRSSHSDLLPWNMILQGKNIVSIDDDGEFFADPSKCLLYSIKFALLTNYADIEKYFLTEPHPNSWENGTTTQIMRGILAEIAPGELIDKITILEIKKEKVVDANKLKNILYELSVLQNKRDSEIPSSPELDNLTLALKEVNQKLWVVEDELREKEMKKEFDDEFIQKARSVYFLNDERARIKRAINDLCGSDIIEEKLYATYKKSRLFIH